ncbi:MAG: cadherin repeat domain-containing protein, partial [bacterium]
LLLLMGMLASGIAQAQTINVDVKPSSSSAAYSGSDGVLSSGGNYWNHSVSNAANLAYENGTLSGVALVLLQHTGWSLWSSSTKIFSAGIGLYGAYDDFPASYGAYDLDPYKTYDVVIYFGRGAGSGNAYGVGTIYHGAGSSWDMCSANSDNQLPGTRDITYLRFTNLAPYEVSSNRFGLRIAAEKHTTASYQVYLAGLQIKNTGIRDNIPPRSPTPKTPANNETGILLTPVLTASPFSDYDVGDTQANSQWVVDNNSDFSSPEWDSGDTYGAATSVTVSAGSLAVSTRYYWRVRYKDSAGNWSLYSSAFNFVTASGNTAPTNILLSGTNVAENLSVGTKVGHFTAQDPDAGNTFTYSLVAGSGSTDNGSFSISGSNLLTAAVYNYEVKSNFSIRVQAMDQGGLTTQKAFVIAVTDVDEKPEMGKLAAPAGSGLVLQWSSITNHRYTVCSSTNLQQGFSVVRSNIVATVPLNAFTDSVQGVSRKFWQIRTDP